VCGDASGRGCAGRCCVDLVAQLQQKCNAPGHQQQQQNVHVADGGESDWLLGAQLDLLWQPVLLQPAMVARGLQQSLVRCSRAGSWQRHCLGRCRCVEMQLADHVPRTSSYSGGQLWVVRMWTWKPELSAVKCRLLPERRLCSTRVVSKARPAQQSMGNSGSDSDRFCGEGEDIADLRGEQQPAEQQSAGILPQAAGCCGGPGRSACSLAQLPAVLQQTQ